MDQPAASPDEWEHATVSPFERAEAVTRLLLESAPADYGGEAIEYDNEYDEALEAELALARSYGEL
jgi:hypothetical protein